MTPPPDQLMGTRVLVEGLNCGGCVGTLTRRVGGIDGVLEQRDGEYRVQLVAPIAAVAHARRPDKPPEVDGDLRVASFNVLNYFNGDGAGGGFPTVRGAQNADDVRAILDRAGPERGN